MRKLLTALLISAILYGPFAPLLSVPEARAEDRQAQIGELEAQIQQLQLEASTYNDANDPGGAKRAGIAGQIAGLDTQIDGLLAKEKTDPTACFSWRQGFNWATCIKTILTTVSILFNGIAMQGLAFCNMVFSYALYVSIYEFHDYATTDAITGIWRTFLDLINLFMVFILIYIAIATTFNLKNTNFRRLVRNVIVFALLINFSLIVPRVFIDVTNLVALQFYNRMGEVVPGTDGIRRDVAITMVNTLHPFDLVTLDPRVTDPQDTVSTVFIKGVGSFIVMFVMGFILLLGALLFIWRTLVLLTVLVTTPIAFLGFILPSKTAQEIWEKWWNLLFSQAIFAPAYLLLLYFAVEITLQMPPRTVIVQSTSPGIALTVYFVIIAGLMLACIDFSQRFATAGTGKILNMGAKARSGVKQWGLQKAADIPRNYVSGTADKVVKSGWYNNMIDNNPTVGRLTHGSLSSVANARWAGLNRQERSDQIAAPYTELTRHMNDEQTAKFLQRLGGGGRITNTINPNRNATAAREVFQRMSAEQRGRVQARLNVGGTQTSEQATATRRLESGLSSRERAAMSRHRVTAERDMDVEKEIKELNKEFENAGNSISGAVHTKLAGVLDKLHGKHAPKIAELDPTMINHMFGDPATGGPHLALMDHVSSAHLEALHNNNTLSSAQKTKLAEAIQNSGSTTNQVKSAKNWLRRNPHFST